jgi:cell volume regulation protein A
MIFLLVGGMLLGLVLIIFVFRRLNIPLILLALLVGILFGSDVTGLIYFDDAILTRDIATVALLFILFAGGFGIKEEEFRPVAIPAGLLATIGVWLTAFLTAFGLVFLTKKSFLEALLLSVIISSTDAAAVFSLFGTSLRHKVASLIKIESASNDPAAIISTLFVLQFFMGATFALHSSFLRFLWLLFGGAVIGLIIGKLAAMGLRKLTEIDIGYFSVFLLGVIFFCFGVSEVFKSSGILAVFFCGLVMGNEKLPYKHGLGSFAETLSFLANISLFILLGLLVFPKQLLGVWREGIGLFLIVSLVARPLAVFLCTSGSKFSWKEKLFISWSGIRGAVPIVLATYPLAMGLDPHHRLFNTIFFAVTLSVTIQGGTLPLLKKLLGLKMKQKRKHTSSMQLVTIHNTTYELLEIHLDETLYEGECKVADLQLPQGVTITMITRKDGVIAPSGQTIIRPGDTLFVLAEDSKKGEVLHAILSHF